MIRMMATMVTATATTTGVTTELEPVPAERPDLDESPLSPLGTTVLSWVTTTTKIKIWELSPENREQKVFKSSYNNNF